MAIDDPNKLTDVDRAIAANERELNPLPWHDVEADADTGDDADEMTDAEYEAYFEKLSREKKPGDPDYIDPADYGEELAAWHNAPMTSAFEQLTRAGIDLPAPEELDDKALHAKLWEVIHALAERNTFLSCTDHLDDRALYTLLWYELLHEWCKDLEAMLPPDKLKGAHAWVQHLDLLGSGSEEDTILYVRYYATGADRELWTQDWPDDWGPVPDYEKPPYDRDRHLPQPPDEPDGPETFDAKRGPRSEIDPDDIPF